MGSRDPATLVERAAAGDRAALGRLLTLVERGGEPARTVARLVHPRAWSTYTVGITGSPGAGKSTLTDALVGHLRRRSHAVGVLAVDPSSPRTGGAILGDRVRMQGHAGDDGVVIRSMASRGHLGGLALCTPEAIRVMDAAGLPIVLVETVGVGQVEVAVAGAADTTVVVVTPGWGDAVQVSKAGLVEVADVIVVNKADLGGAEAAVADLLALRGLVGDQAGGWHPPVVTTVAVAGDGVDALWDAVARHRAHLESGGELTRRRRRRLAGEVSQIVQRRLEHRATAVIAGPAFAPVVAEVEAGRMDPGAAADALLAGVVPSPSNSGTVRGSDSDGSLCELGKWW